VVRTLEALAADPAFRAEAAAWQAARLPAACDGTAPSQAPHAPAVAVTALYSAQVRLLRLLVADSPVLAAAGLARVADGHFRLGDIDLVVDAPPALRQRECHTLLLSLTRSHTHRAVAFGEHAGWLPLALTRADARLLAFGDPGTLARRAEWHGAVDHLDETAGEREREVVAELSSHLPESEVLLSAPSPVGSVRR
jgi:hypothetical protein